MQNINPKVSTCLGNQPIYEFVSHNHRFVGSQVIVFISVQNNTKQFFKIKQRLRRKRKILVAYKQVSASTNWALNGWEVFSGRKNSKLSLSLDRKDEADHMLFGWYCHWSITAGVLQLGLFKWGNDVLVKECTNI